MERVYAYNPRAHTGLLLPQKSTIFTPWRQWGCWTHMAASEAGTRAPCPSVTSRLTALTLGRARLSVTTATPGQSHRDVHSTTPRKHLPQANNTELGSQAARQNSAVYNGSAVNRYWILWLGTCEASRFDSNSNRMSWFEFDSKVMCRFENFESAAHAVHHHTINYAHSLFNKNINLCAICSWDLCLQLHFTCSCTAVATMFINFVYFIKFSCHHSLTVRSD